MPSPLTDEEGDFILIHHEDLRLSQKAEEVYAQLQKMLLEQHEVSGLLLCLPLSVPTGPSGKGVGLRSKRPGFKFQLFYLAVVTVGKVL